MESISPSLLYPVYEKPSGNTFDLDSILSLLSSTCGPYAELIRLQKPVGTLNAFFPYLFGFLFAACTSPAPSASFSMSSPLMTLLLSSFLLRSLGCAWNDLCDSDFDKQVARCRSRPIARGAVSVRDAWLFCGAFTLLSLAILYYKTDLTGFLYILPTFPMAAAYPLFKRFSQYPQVFLGLTFSWGIIVGCRFYGLTPTQMVRSSNVAYALVALVASYIIWTVIHDTVYAFQDIKDDKHAGVKSMAVRFEDQAIPLLAALSVLQVVGLAAVGLLVQLGWGYYTGMAAVTLLLVTMIFTLDVTNARQCKFWFQYGSMGFGVAISAGFTLQYLLG